MNGDKENRDVLLEMVDAAITKLTEPSAESGTGHHCGDHWKVVDGVVVLLRCQRARLRDSGGLLAGGGVGAIGAAIMGAAIVLGRYLGIGGQ